MSHPLETMQCPHCETLLVPVDGKLFCQHCDRFRGPDCDEPGCVECFPEDAD